ncbi:hypothetical protein [Mucilaginibacter myungsuensis]|uniref:Uncharacterized protein n=1 Tax=Mucilaginibacter myungsuensis TaxID=649104 RepID=A0A929KZS8_9SPHI|nr:hypothetical protein [Mucilaginibacter myungsuensis]MBE9663478.1 hypothetical protein [Mucilaginibacter myungsuensis]MDN3600216.1 hypothetical protein [Mucilaginibacter myungsuensis]
MKQQEVFKKIGGIVAELNDQYQYLLTTGELNNDLELELMAANAQFLSGHIEILRKVNASLAKEQPVVAALPPAPVVELLPEVATPEPVVEEEKRTPEPSFFTPIKPEDDADAHVIEFEIPRNPEVVPEPEPEPVAGPEQIRHELSLEDIGEDWDEDEEEIEEPTTRQAPVAEPEPIKVEAQKPEPFIEVVKPALPESVMEPIRPVVPEPVVAQTAKPEPVVQEAITAQVITAQPEPIIASQPHTVIAVPEDHVMTLNERMSAQLNAGRVPEHLAGKPIADLKSAISLNDKLLYVKDLFNGYSLAYSEAIDILNRYKSLEEAQAFLNGSYATKNNWADKQATADKFYDLLRRRYL